MKHSLPVTTTPVLQDTPTHAYSPLICCARVVLLGERVCVASVSLHGRCRFYLHTLNVHNSLTEVLEGEGGNKIFLVTHATVILPRDQMTPRK